MYVKKAERQRRELLNNREFISQYFNLHYDKEDKTGFPWKLKFKTTSRVYTGHRVKWSAQEFATESDNMINEAINLRKPDAEGSPTTNREDETVSQG